VEVGAAATEGTCAGCVCVCGGAVCRAGAVLSHVGWDGVGLDGLGARAVLAALHFTLLPVPEPCGPSAACKAPPPATGTHPLLTIYCT